MLRLCLKCSEFRPSCPRPAPLLGSLSCFLCVAHGGPEQHLRFRRCGYANLGNLTCRVFPYTSPRNCHTPYILGFSSLAAAPSGQSCVFGKQNITKIYMLIFRIISSKYLFTCSCRRFLFSFADRVFGRCV